MCVRVWRVNKGAEQVIYDNFDGLMMMMAGEFRVNLCGVKDF